MKLRFEDGVLWFGDDGVRCNSDYVDRSVVHSLVCRLWGERVNTEASSLFLPYSLDDEYVSAFEYKRFAQDVCVLRCVELDGAGYDHGEDDPVVVCASANLVVARRERDFCRVEYNAIVGGIDESWRSTSETRCAFAPEFRLDTSADVARAKTIRADREC